MLIRHMITCLFEINTVNLSLDGHDEIEMHFPIDEQQQNNHRVKMSQIES